MKHRHLSFLRRSWIYFSEKNMVCTNSPKILLKAFSKRYVYRILHEDLHGDE